MLHHGAAQRKLHTAGKLALQNGRDDLRDAEHEQNADRDDETCGERHSACICGDVQEHFHQNRHRDDGNAQQHGKNDEQNKLRNVLTDEVKGMPVLLFLHFKISFLLSELIM